MKYLFLSMIKAKQDSLDLSLEIPDEPPFSVTVKRPRPETACEISVSICDKGREKNL
jgi:hypothetical protein